MEPLTIAAAIGTLAGTAGKVIDLVDKASKKASDDPEVQRALGEAQDLIIGLRQSILGLQEDVLRLQAENSELREQIRQRKAGALEREGYELKSMGRDAAVVPKGESEPLYCPNCFHSGKLRILSSIGLSSRRMPSHRCGICKSTFHLR